MTQNAAEKYWTEHPDAGKQRQWTGNALVAETIYRRMSGGTPKFWLSWVLEEHFAGRKFKRMLSPGCGMGDHEVIAASTRRVKHVDAFDFSETALEAGREKARAAGVSVNFYKDDLNAFVLPEGVKYDLVMCSGSLHHVRELERFLETVVSAMAPDGHFVVNEYVGACYNLYRQRQVELVDRLLKCFPPELRLGERLQVANIRHALAQDPSESVRSALIVPFLEQYFDVELTRDYGGGILHPLYPLLNHERIEGGGPGERAAVALLLEIEQILMEREVLPTDFTLRICRPKAARTGTATG